MQISLQQALAIQLAVNGKVQKYDLCLIKEDVERQLNLQFNDDEWLNYKNKYLFYTSGTKKEAGDIPLYAVNYHDDSIITMSHNEVSEYAKRWQVIDVKSHLPVLMLI